MGTIINVITPYDNQYLDFIYSPYSWEYKIWWADDNIMHKSIMKKNNYFEAMREEGYDYIILFKFEIDEIL